MYVIRYPWTFPRRRRGPPTSHRGQRTFLRSNQQGPLSAPKQQQQRWMYVEGSCKANTRGARLTVARKSNHYVANPYMKVEGKANTMGARFKDGKWQGSNNIAFFILQVTTHKHMIIIDHPMPFYCVIIEQRTFLRSNQTRAAKRN